MCFHLKSIKSNLAKWFGSATSYNSLIQVLLYWDFVIQSESLCSKKWTSRSLRFCKSQTSLGFVSSEPFTTVVFIHFFLQGSGELKTLWLKQAQCVREKTLPQSYAGRNARPTYGRYAVFLDDRFRLAPSSFFLSCSKKTWTDWGGSKGGPCRWSNGWRTCPIEERLKELGLFTL